jgi:hypothetical protein
VLFRAVLNWTVFDWPMASVKEANGYCENLQTTQDDGSECISEMSYCAAGVGGVRLGCNLYAHWPDLHAYWSKYHQVLKQRA